MATHRILSVCAQNICRSPYLAFRLASGLAAGAHTAEWILTDRGTIVQSARPICELSAKRLGAAGEDFARGHASRLVSVTDVNSAHFIVTATAAERSAIARIQPEARSRTFTLREALAMGKAPVSASELRAAIVAGRPAASLRTYASILNHRRGTVDVDARQRWMPMLGRQALPPFDTPDWHTGKPAQHAKLFDELDADSAALIANVSRFLDLARA